MGCMPGVDGKYGLAALPETAMLGIHQVIMSTL